MIERTVLYSFLCVLSFNIIIAGQTHPDPKLDSLILSTLNNLENQRYIKVKENISLLKKIYPDCPLGNLYEAAFYITRADDFGIPFEDGKIDSLLNEADRQCDSLIDLDENNIWVNYFKALSAGYISYYKALNGNYFSAYNWAGDANNYYDRCIELDSSFYDAYASIGTYQYWVGEKTKFINWIPLIPDEREEGIKNIILAFEKSRYNKAFIGTQLFWIYINEKMYHEALEVASELKKYSESRTIKFLYAHILAINKNDSAIVLFSEILDSYPREKIKNNLKRIQLLNRIAELQYELGYYNKTILTCDNIISIDNLSEYVNNRLLNKIDDVKELKNKALRRLNEIER